MWLSMRRGFFGRCPNCGKGKIFRAFLKVADRCPACDEALHHHRADDAPAYFVILIVGHVVVPLALVVEVAASSLTLDREHKGSLYARARVADYWIVNLVDRVLEVYRDPRPDAGATYGWAYRVVLTLGPDEHVAPLAAPSARILAADLLP